MWFIKSPGIAKSLVPRSEQPTDSYFVAPGSMSPRIAGPARAEDVTHRFERDNQS